MPTSQMPLQKGRPGKVYTPEECTEEELALFEPLPSEAEGDRDEEEASGHYPPDL